MSYMQIQLFGSLRQEDCLSPGVQGYPWQHNRILSLTKHGMQISIMCSDSDTHMTMFMILSE